MDFVKKNWQFRDIISEDELNRMEDGIEEGITKAEQAQQTADDAATAAANAQNDIDDYKNEIRSLGFGLNVNPRLSSDLNNEVEVGWVTTDENTLNRPSGRTHGVVRIDRRFGHRVSQTYYDLDGAVRVRVFTRVLGTSWSNWVEMLHTGNTTNIVNQDYETGTWTPVLEGLDVPGNHTYSVQRGNYHRIGHRVFVNGEIRIISSGYDTNMRGGLVITGLPFPQRNTINDSAAFAVGYRGGIDMSKYTHLHLDRGESFLILTDGQWLSTISRLTHEDLSNHIHISFSGHYRI